MTRWSKRDFQHILQSIWRNCADALMRNSFIGDFFEFTDVEIDSLREKGRFLFLKTEVCLRELSLHLAQSSKFPSIFNSSSLNLDYAKRKNKNTIPRGIKIMKSHIIYYHRCKTEGNKAAVGNMIVSGNSFSNIRK